MSLRYRGIMTFECENEAQANDCKERIVEASKGCVSDLKIDIVEEIVVKPKTRDNVGLNELPSVMDFDELFEPLGD